MNKIDDILMEMSPYDLEYQFRLAMNAVKKASSKLTYNMRKLDINIKRRRINNNHHKRHGVAMYRRRAYLKALQNEMKGDDIYANGC